MENTNKRNALIEKIENTDYQIKVKELAKEVVFLRQFGVKNDEHDV